MKRSLLHLGLAVGILGIALGADAEPKQKRAPGKDRERPRADRRVNTNDQFTKAMRQYGEAYKNGNYKKAKAIAQRLRKEFNAGENGTAKPNQRIKKERSRSDAEMGERRRNERPMQKDRRVDRERQGPREDGMGRLPFKRGEQPRHFAQERRGEMECFNQPRANMGRRPEARMAEGNRNRRSDSDSTGWTRMRERPMMCDKCRQAMRANRQNRQNRNR